LDGEAMTERILTDAEIAEALALCEKLTTDDWPNGRRKPWTDAVGDFYEFYRAAREGYPAALRQLRETRAALRAIFPIAQFSAEIYEGGQEKVNKARTLLGEE
jgi:hypothetical protein